MIERTASSACRVLIKRFEGFMSKAYKPKVTTVVNGKKIQAESKEAYYTIGWGHSGPDIKKDDIISYERAEFLLTSDLARCAKALNTLCKETNVELNQNQFDALISFSYNTGTHALSNSTLWKYLESGEIDKASAQFERWVYASGVKSTALVTRRAQERKLFDTKDD